MALSARSWVANEGGKHLVLVLWLGANTLVFMRTFLLYYCGQQYHYLHQMLGLGLCISRASASVLNLNCSLVLLPMCRSLLTYLRGTHTVTSRKARRLLDKSKTFHVACGVAICVFSVVHVSAHLVNVVNFSVGYSEEFPSLNVARYRGEDPRLIILTTVPGITGILLVLILFLMFTASSYCIRVSNYEIFWYTHNLFIVFYIILIVHVVGGALKYQTNFEAHPPGCLRANQTNPDKTEEESGQAEGDGWSCREEARFQPNSPEYIVLNCPSVSSFENHPFTLTACPTEKKETLGIHLRVVGDWTERFTELLLPDPGAESEILPMVQQRRYPKLYVDGPFGSSSQEVFNYEVSLCVAGGIGVTPFACVLHALLDGWRHFRLRRLYFVWVCRELQSFYWFAELLCALHHKLWKENRPDYLNLQLFVSQTDGLQNISEERYRPLSSRLMIGRPRWKLLFEEIGRTNKHKRVGVFCCGPKGISRTLHRLCNSDRYSGTTFEFNKESFS
ncbi:NADPH oxidase 4 isoform X1 [Oncorhynchus keta]|uniref:NADPH oxidase 4 isoform X1 n=1 Tax=Oncorhynchus keta TaxID=8018 RepID=UPI00227B1A5F|nr:NADPH oxidase 4 isoform X1 [Oncorhynchus keta]